MTMELLGNNLSKLKQKNKDKFTLKTVLMLVTDCTDDLLQQKIVLAKTVAINSSFFTAISRPKQVSSHYFMFSGRGGHLGLHPHRVSPHSDSSRPLKSTRNLPEFWSEIPLDLYKGSIYLGNF